MGWLALWQVASEERLLMMEADRGMAKALGKGFLLPRAPSPAILPCSELVQWVLCSSQRLFSSECP